MPRKTSISHGFAVPKGEALTLDDLAEFVQNAREAGIPGSAVVSGQLRFSGQLHAVTVNSDKVRAPKDAPAD